MQQGVTLGGSYSGLQEEDNLCVLVRLWEIRTVWEITGSDSREELNCLFTGDGLG